MKQLTLFWMILIFSSELAMADKATYLQNSGKFKKSIATAVLAQHNCATCPSAKAGKKNACCGGGAAADTLAAAKQVWNALPGYGKKAWIGNGFYFTYKFDKKPKMGTSILKVMLYDKKGKQVKDMEVTGKSGMPSMGGAHDAEAAFKLNKKGDYLLPVNFVMPGEWEVRLTFKKGGIVVYLGAFKLNV
jgi:hypothetical protein